MWEPIPSVSSRMREPIPVPPRRTCPHEDGCGNPSPPVVLADALTHPPRCPRGCVDPSPPVVPADAWTHSPPVVPADAGTHPLPPPPSLSSRMRGPIPLPRGEPAPMKTDAGTHPHPLSSRMRGPIPTRCPRGCVDPSPSLSPRMRGPIPTLSSRMRETHAHPLSPRMRGPTPPPPLPVAFADGWTHPPPVVLADAGIHPPPPTRQSRAPLTPLPLLSSWQAHDGDGASSADRSPCPPGLLDHRSSKNSGSTTCSTSAVCESS